MNMICPVCGTEYLGWVTRCADCGVAVVVPAEAPNPLDLPEEEQVVYELGEWSLDLQAAAAAAMAEAGIPHGFDGADLVVHVNHESAVDALLDEVEHGPDGRADGEPTTSTLVYELDEWHQAARDELCTRLEEGSVPYRMDGDQLVVDPADEEAVDFLVSEVRTSVTETAPADEDDDAVGDDRAVGAEDSDVDRDEDDLDDSDDDGDGDGDGDSDGDGDGDSDVSGDDRDDRRAVRDAPARLVSSRRAPADDGVGDDEDPEVLGRLYLTAASLADDPADPAALVDLLDFSDSLDENRPPFGVDNGFWEQVLVVVDDLADAIAGPDPDDDGDDDASGDEPARAVERSPSRGQFIPQRAMRDAEPTPAAAAPVMHEEQARRLARRLRSMLQEYV